MPPLGKPPRLPKHPELVPRPADGAPRPPRYHYESADRLLAELAELDDSVLMLPFARAKVARAAAHAALAQCPWPEDQAAELEPTTTCRHCNFVITRVGGQWIHTYSGRTECFRDSKHPATATPGRK